MVGILQDETDPMVSVMKARTACSPVIIGHTHAAPQSCNVFVCICGVCAGACNAAMCYVYNTPSVCGWLALHYVLLGSLTLRSAGWHEGQRW